MKMHMSALCAAIMLAGTMGRAATNEWFDAQGREQIIPLPGSPAVCEFSPDDPDYDENYGNGSIAYDGSTGGSTTYFKGPPGCWYRIDLMAPLSRGTISYELSRIRVADAADNKRYHLEVCADDTPVDGPWVRVVENALSTGDGEYQTFDFDPVPSRFVRMINVDGGWLNLKEIDFYGRAIADAPARDFRHPATLVTGPILDLLKKRLDEGTHPTGVTWQELREKWPTGYEPQTKDSIYTPFGGSPDDEFLRRDGEAAYGRALMWYMTGEQAYADDVVRILDAWSASMAKVYGGNTSLTWGMWLGTFLFAAEIIATTDAGWPDAGARRFVQWVSTCALPPLEAHVQKDYLHGNWATIINRTTLAYAVLTENPYQFNRLIELYTRQMAAPTQTAPWGEVHETCRTWNADGLVDLVHFQMFLSGAVGLCEIAWNQGVDLYAWKNEADGAEPTSLGYRLATCLNYNAGVLNVGNDVSPAPRNLKPNDYWPGYFRNEDGSRFMGEPGGVSAWGWEVAYNHYVNVKGVALPEVAGRIQYTRERDGRDGMVHSSGWGTYTHADIGNPVGDIVSLAGQNSSGPLHARAVGRAPISAGTLFDLRGRIVKRTSLGRAEPTGVFIHRTTGREAGVLRLK